jgi:peptide/nickel transport system substrate-binding protein
MSRKAVTRVQAAIAIIVIIAAVAAGAYFATSRAPSGPSATSNVQNPDTIVEETIGQPDTLDPATDYETAGGAIIQNVYENLLFFNGAHADQVVPWLAQSYDLSSDGLTYTFHLRSGITFTDGTPFDANAVYFSLMRALILDDPDGPAWAMLQVIRGGANFSKQYNNMGPSAPNGYGDKYTQSELQDLLNAKPVEVLDPMTVAIHLERPYAGWSFVMAFSIAAIVSPTAFKAHWTAPTDGTPYIEGATAGDYHSQANPWVNENMVGTGPYMLKSWDKASQTLVLVRNDNYWGTPYNRGKAPIPNVIIKGIDDPNTRVLDLKAGSSDIGTIPTTGGLIFQFVDQTAWFEQGNLVTLSPDFQVYPQCPPSPRIQGKCLWPSFSTFFMGYNQKINGPDRKPQAFQPFSDSRIRKAFTLSFNRTAYIHDVVQDFAIPATQIIPPGMFGYDPTISETPYDPTQAKQLLMDAGANPLTPDNAYSPASPKTVQISYNLGNTARETAATIVANTINSFASDTGLYATVTGLAWPQFLASQRAKQLNVFFLGWIVDYVDPDDFLVPFAHATAGTFAIRMGYNNPDVTRLIDQQATITDKAQRLQVISQIEHMTNDDNAFLWLNYGVVQQVSRAWLHERANASVAAGISAYNQAIYGYYYYELEKGGSMSPTAAQPTLLSLILLPTMGAFFSVKKSF